MNVDLERKDIIYLLKSVDGNCFVFDTQEPVISALEILEKKSLVEIHEIEPNTNGYQLDYEWKLNDKNFINMSDEELFKMYKKFKDLK